MKIAIIGAGIGGLTLALALRQRGIQADIFEQAPALTEIGAASPSANAMRELDRLGLMPGLEAVMRPARNRNRPDFIQMRQRAGV